MDKLRAMQTFVAIVDQGSLSAAARALDSSLPAVVRTLAALETSLDVRLLNRTTRRIALTEEGRTYLDTCRQILSELQEAEARLAARHEAPSGTLVVTAPVLFGQLHVAPALYRFLRAYPAVKCRLLLNDRVVNLWEEGIDVGIRISPLDDSTLVAQSLGAIRRVVVASPACLAEQGEVKHPRDLAGKNCIRSHGGGFGQWRFWEGGREFVVPVDGNLEVSHGLTAIDACLGGMGYGCFLSYQVAAPMADGRLVRVLKDYEGPARPVNIVYPHARLLPSRTRVFVEWMKRELRDVSMR
ncbi:LysR family transcriptional regulator [Pandoraea sp. XJJ-1]|uniref:LysR family transcriptional regulator n=1 Tax=unclassified Pandoraea TaxID=2624094 RepID=UPI000361B274|nr:MULTISPECIES: LysR family transcriptional regulator [unclassified Pandoraea]OJY21368.1 MAG: LysR family transcriptional regulator [Pandoraea sp. 64-18]WAL83208.1 LysR family transcriptional regulator [Pandoraea sp. XJJ-1]